MTCPQLELSLEMSQSEIDAVIWIVKAEWRCSYFRLFTHRQKTKQISVIYEGRRRIQSGLVQTYFTDSNVYCRCGCNIVYCKDYHMIAVTVFQDVALL